MTRPRRYPQGSRLPRGRLSGDVVAVLLEGWASSYQPGPEEDAFEVFTCSDADLWRLFLHHERELLAEWRRRGGVGPTWIERQREADLTLRRQKTGEDDDLPPAA